MKSFIYPEMMVHVPLCTSKNPKNVLIVSDNAELLIQEVQRHSDINAEVIGCSLDAIRDLAAAQYDAIVCEMGGDALSLAHISRALKEDGQLSIVHPSLEEVEANKELMKILGNYFKIIMPYNLGNGTTALLASKEYHPTADIILQRADMLDGLSYYNCDVHPASFATPNYIRKEYLGIIRN
ncbi:spermidine synthase [bacterium]|nr:spermidine synthase [bacterium]MBU1993715.1 spermidine synthase [bacterium]